MLRSTIQPAPRPVIFPVYRLIDISPDLAVAANHVAAVKRTDEDKCVVYLAGQSATEGFVVEAAWDQVVGDLNDELERAVEEAEGDEQDGNEDDDEEGKKED